MIVFHCPCGYTWILDLESAKAIGPIYNSNTDKEKPFIGNHEKPIAFGALRDFYGDCWSVLERKITS